MTRTALPNIGSVWTHDDTILTIREVTVEDGVPTARGMTDDKIPASISLDDLTLNFREARPSFVKRLTRAVPVKITGQFQSLPA